MEVHYQKTFFNGRTLHVAARNFLNRLPKNVNTLVSAGSSGCAIATAMVALSDRNLRHVFIRKTYELKTHGDKFVGFEYGMQDDCTCAIVDDFIASGRTVRRLMKAVPERELNVTTILVGDAPGFNSQDTIEKLERQFRIKVIIV